jgi:hypothetical protein
MSFQVLFLVLAMHKLHFNVNTFLNCFYFLFELLLFLIYGCAWPDLGLLILTLSH